MPFAAGVAGLGLALFAAVSAFAVHDQVFQLDGNTTVDPPGTGEFASAIYDWESLFDDNATGSVGGSGTPDVTLVDSFTDADFVEDWGLAEGGTFDTSDPSTFTQSKDDEDIDEWRCVGASNVTDKGDITNAYAALWEEGDDRILYFGMEKTQDNGDNNVGLWILQDPSVDCEEGGTGNGEAFTGNHVNGDIFIVSEFTNGGGVSSVQVYEWLDGDLVLIATGLDCADTAAGDDVCATTNSTDIDPQWDHFSKDNGVNGDLEPASFLEGAINLSAYEEFADSCFTGFLFNTRSSQETTAILYDYALGDIDTCNPDLSLDKAPEDQQHNVGESFEWTLEVTNSGDGPADDALVADTIPTGLTIDDVTVDPAEAGDCVVDGQDIECTIDVAVNGSVTITVDVTSTVDVFEADEGCVEVTNTGTVSVEGDTVTEGDSDSVVATICRPLVDKTAAGSFTHDVQWEIEKTVDIDQHTMLAGEDADSTYTVTVTKTVQDSDFEVSGTITIENPNDEDSMTVDVTDALSSGESLGATAIDCPATEDGDDLVIAAGATVVCEYTVEPADAESGTNTATVTLNSIEFDATAAYTFTPTNTGEPEEISVTDVFDGDAGTDLGTVSDTTTFDDYTHNFACSTDETEYTNGHYEEAYPNTASIDETVGDSDSETVTLDCYIPLVEKTAAGTYEHGVDWTITKSVDIDQHTMLAGEDADSTYTVSVDKEVTDSDFAVAGSITVTNPSSQDAMTVDITDALSSGETAAETAIDCPGTEDGDDLVVAAGATVVCTYSIAAADADSGTNTATVKFSSDSAVSVSDDAAYTFTATNSGDPETINVTDVFDGDGGTALGSASDDTTFATYTHNFECPTDESLYENGHYEDTFPNTASIDETDDEASETVELDCYIPTITKTADASFDRDWDWTIVKEGDQSNLLLQGGQTFDVNYTVTVDPTATDSSFDVAGSITVANASTEDDMTVDVTDLLSTGEAIAATDIDCGGGEDGDDVTVPFGDSIVCTYAFDDVAGVAADDAGTNTATATFSNDAQVSVSDDDDYSYGLDSETDECIDVEDTLGGVLGTVCADADPADFVFTYTYTITGGECGETTVNNVASFLTIDQDGEDDDTGSDTWDVVVTVDCPEGCTLTQGYWKTHSEYGPAPEDETWLLLPDLDGDSILEGPGETFYKSGMSWYQVFWTAPKGNVYYNLAHQYMAAYLNTLAGADSPANVDAAMVSADALFKAWTPADVAKLKGNKQPRPQFISLAGTLASYNEGAIGPGHCDEDQNSIQGFTL